ncbi:protease complex subunit PrcB family protein [Pustulibacterium marinum]|nr:protease complex subunit PrcB family protein [Pustulibacterium marinum]
MKKLLSTLSILSFLIFMSCDSTEKVVAASKKQEPTWEVLLQKSHGGPEDAKIIVAKEPSIVEEFYAQINTNVSPGYEIPALDYSKEMLLILCMGQRSTGGYAINVTDIEETTSMIKVTVAETSPEPGGLVTTALTSPFTIVKTKYSDKKVVFNKK